MIGEQKKNIFLAISHVKNGALKVLESFVENRMGCKGSGDDNE